MKFAVFMLVLTISLVSMTTARRSRVRCSSNKDCSENECCITRGILSFRKGDCRPLAKDGENCSEDDDELLEGRYAMHCPCEIGLTCKPTKETDLGKFGKLKYNERCVSEPSTKEPDTEAPTVGTEATVAETEVTTEA